MKINQPLSKAELLHEGIFLLIHLFARDILLMKKFERPPSTYSSFKTDIREHSYVTSDFWVGR